MAGAFSNGTYTPFKPTGTTCELVHLVPYTVNAISVQDVTASVNLAQKHNIHLVINNTVHEYVCSILPPRFCPCGLSDVISDCCFCEAPCRSYIQTFYGSIVCTAQLLAKVPWASGHITSTLSMWYSTTAALPTRAPQ